jgi:hypothetical protein
MDRKNQETATGSDIRWDDSTAHNTRADVFQIKSSREETMLLFGTREPQVGDPSEQRISMGRCIVLSPAMAKQLATALNRAAREYEARPGSVDAMPAGRFQTAPGDVDVPLEAKPMFERVRGLNVGFGFEKSFKMSQGSLLGDRLILGVRSELADPRSLVEVCRHIGMPAAYLTLFEESLPGANTIGFGYEGSERGGVYKVYLEFWERLRQHLQSAPTDVSPAPLFLGFKWDLRDNTKSAVARYTCYPLLSVQGILRRLSALYRGHDDSLSLQAAREIVGLAARKVGNDSFVYVEAAEEGNPRKSFDLNLYKAGLRVGELQPVLSALSRRYSIAAGQFEHLDAEAGMRPFGHLSGGLGRDGRDFLTVYYEIEGL